MKNILITGASGGIGIEIAKELAEKGNRLFLVYHQNDVPVIMLKQNHAKDCTIEIFKCDLTDSKSVDSLIETIVTINKKIDCVINCAGVSTTKQIQDTTSKDFDFIFKSNVKSTVNVIKSASKSMISEKYGRIINISSVWGVVGSSTESLYSATKGAINSLTLALAKELGPSGITVNAICPGFINTKMNSQYSKEDVDAIASETPMQRIGQPEDVAGLVKFLLGDQASFITGQIIRVDGGWTL